MVRRLVLVLAIGALAGGSALAQPAPDQGAPVGPEAALSQKIAVWRFDALSIEPELVARLETLFRMELGRLSKVPLPSRRDIERAITADQQQCTGEEKCLAAIGKKLGVDIVITGTVGAMGSDYVLNIKAVEVATAKQVQRTVRPAARQPRRVDRGRARRGVQAARAEPAARIAAGADRHRRRRGAARRQADRQGHGELPEFP